MPPFAPDGFFPPPLGAFAGDAVDALRPGAFADVAGAVLADAAFGAAVFFASLAPAFRVAGFAALEAADVTAFGDEAFVAFVAFAAFGAAVFELVVAAVFFVSLASPAFAAVVRFVVVDVATVNSSCRRPSRPVL
ncbi:MAG TPA: hypothetical protein VLA76_06600 [Candidatus Angelobacter sp.]|nr:hypothetical protein [Candidatus Angelobacter sp.]